MLLMWPPFFFGVIPIYGVLPYAMIVSENFRIACNIVHIVLRSNTLLI